MSEGTDPIRPKGEIVLYQPPEGSGQIRVLLEGETVWLPQGMIAELFQTSVPNINIHLKNIYEEGELDETATIKEYLIVRQEGSRKVSRKVLHYSLDAILAVGYRVKSPVATRFREWATARLHEYLVKGFTLNDDRLKGTDSVTDYFDELLARIREIRASEARVYQRIREIFALAVDYREGEQETQQFFATMQNKMHYAATALTAAEIIRRRANAAQPNMGLTAWKGDRVIKRDIGTAKNCLNAEEIDTLNRITVMFLDQAEFRAQRRQDIHMHDWQAFLDKFLRDTELPVLADAGSVSHEDALDWAREQYDAFADRRRLEAEKQAESRYVEDLRTSAKTLEQERKKKTPKKKQAKAKKKAARTDQAKEEAAKDESALQLHSLLTIHFFTIQSAMPCIIAMTTERPRWKAAWDSEPGSLRNWCVFRSALTHTAAQQLETKLAAQFGCQSHYGGNDPDRPSSWTVYGFDHSGW